jgi:uncharacterized protein YbcI
VGEIGDSPPSGDLRAGVTKLLMETYARHLGRRPADARTYASDELVMCVLKDTLTPAEKSRLVEGRASSVRETRLRIQEAMREELVAGVERLTGRKVVDLITMHDLDPESAFETFVFDARELFFLNGFLEDPGPPGQADTRSA